MYCDKENTVACLNEMGEYCLYQYKGKDLIVYFVSTINQVECEDVQYKSKILCGILHIKNYWKSENFKIIQKD